MKTEAFKCVATDSIMDAMKKIDKNSYGLLYVVDDERLVGCITDGDIRRFLLKGGSIKSTVRKAMNMKPIYVSERMRAEGSMIMIEKAVSSVAVVDDDYTLVDVLLADSHKGLKNCCNSLKFTPVVVMAGGKGTRLYPYTKILPKPLIPIGEVPILERIFGHFVRFGVDDFYLTINYRKEMIKSYFAESDHSFNIHYVEENEPLGTAGSIRLIVEKFDKPVIVTNCDILIEADYGDILKHHTESGNDLTIVSSLRNTVIPYGVLHVDENGIITEMEEKPEVSTFINTGMYVLNPEFIKWIPKGELYHMTQLADKMIQKGKRVGMYPISENSFLDMGEFAEMKRMEERINNSDFI